MSQTDGPYEIRLFESSEEIIREEFDALKEILEKQLKIINLSILSILKKVLMAHVITKIKLLKLVMEWLPKKH